MKKYELPGAAQALYFVSSRCRTWEPAKTIFLLPPEAEAASFGRLERFAQERGWLEEAERDGAVLVLPLAPSGWQDAPDDLLCQLYAAVRKAAPSPALGDERGSVWCWEPLIYLAGYGDGADAAGRMAVAHPNYFADIALVGGAPRRFEASRLPADHWLVPDASDDAACLNREVPVSIAFYGSGEAAETAADYFSQADKTGALVRCCRDVLPDRALTRKIMSSFQTRVRWKNSPNGTLARVLSEEEFMTSGEYLHEQVESNHIIYPYHVRFPKGKKGETHLPVVISMHGHGEPAWLFCTKNGWDRLSDETGEFLLVLPDSPENAWQADRDEAMLARMIAQLADKYRIDTTRVYLTGFSNGSMATCWFGTTHPELFAAISPWNGPMPAAVEQMAQAGWELPMFAIDGDRDHKGDGFRRWRDPLFLGFLRANGCVPRLAQVRKPLGYKFDEVRTGENFYLPEKGYTCGGRFTTYVYHDLENRPRVCYTEMKDMPHGAIYDEARAAWDFLRRFSRPVGSKVVDDATPPDWSGLEELKTPNQGYRFARYTPTSANSYTPSRGMVIIPEARHAGSLEAVGGYLHSSGWLRQANRDASVLLVPMTDSGWLGVEADLIPEIYRTVWGKTPSREHRNERWMPEKQGYDPGSGSMVWMWEVLWNLVGYGDGGELAGRCAVSYPNRFASVTLLGQGTDRFEGGEAPSDHFLVSKEFGKRAERMVGVSADYCVKMKELPSAVLLAGGAADMADYFRSCDRIPAEAVPERLDLGGLPVLRWANEKEPAQRVLTVQGDWQTLTPQRLMELWIGESIRWKNSPDGTLKTFYWQDQVEQGLSPYKRETFRVPGESRDREYYLYLPKNLAPNAPAVISIHGHGEPAWMFISKNGWPQLADREGIIIVSPADNSENRWSDQPDTDTFPLLVDDLCWKYGVDRTRIYISGFSNGNAQCWHTASKYARLFAGMFPMSQAAGNQECLARLRKSGVPMPFFGVTGDNDGWSMEKPAEKDSAVCSTISTLLELAQTQAVAADIPDPFYWKFDEFRGEDYYRARYGFDNADRFKTWVYRDKEGTGLAAVTVMKNMPHGTVWEESEAAWDFLKRFRRMEDGTIQLVDEEEN